VRAEYSTEILYSPPVGLPLYHILPRSSPVSQHLVYNFSIHL
jgi:hypothetical protein